MRATIVGLAALLLALALAPVATPAPARVGKSFDRVLSADTLVFMSLRSASDVRKKLESEPYSKLAADPEIKKWLDSTWSSMAEQFAKMEKEVGFTPKDLWDAVEGEIALFVSELDLKKDKPEPKAFGLLVDSGAKADDFAKLFTRALKNMQEKDFTATTEKVGDVTINVMDKKIPEDGSSTGNRMCAAQVGSVFVLCSNLDTAKDLILHLGAETKKLSLAESETYKSIRDRVGKGEFFLYVNTGVVKDAIAIASKDVPDAMREVLEKAVKELGITSSQGAGLGISLNKDGVRMDGFIALDGYKGLTRLVGKNHNLTFPGSIPKDASSASAMYMDMGEAGKIVDTLLKLAGEVMQAQGGGGDPKEMIKQFVGVDIKEDVIDPLGNEAYMFNRYGKPYTEDSHEMVTVWNLKNGKKFQETVNTLVERISGLTGQDVESEEIQGTKVLKLKNDKAGVEIGIAISGDKMIYGNLKGVREALKAGKDPADGGWKDREEIKPLLAMLPPKGIFGMVMTSEDIEYAVTLMKQGKIPGIGNVPPGGQDVEKAIDKNAKDMPSPETIRKYVQGGVMYATAEDSGLSLVGLFLFKNMTK